MDWNFYINRQLIPAALTALFLFLQFYKPTLLKWAESTKNAKQRFGRAYLLEGFRAVVGNWRATILLPVVLAIGLSLLISFIFQMPLRAQGETLWFALMASGVLNPISEELLVRGFMLGSLLLFVEHLHRREGYKKQKIVKYINYLTLLLFVSYIFAVFHDNSNIFQFSARFASGALFGALYLASGRNLLPPIIAHGSWNIFLIIKDALAL